MFEHETGKGSEPHYEKEQAAYVMICGAEFRGRRDGRVEKGVKNLKVSEAIPQNLFYFSLTFCSIKNIYSKKAPNSFRRY
jgi:hypothetical protein